jgi:hypothetical protein
VGQEPDEETQPIIWTEWSTGTLVNAGPTASHVTSSSTFAVIMEETWHSNQHVQLPNEKSSK